MVLLLQAMLESQSLHQVRHQRIKKFWAKTTIYWLASTLPGKVLLLTATLPGRAWLCRRRWSRKRRHRCCRWSSGGGHWTGARANRSWSSRWEPPQGSESGSGSAHSMTACRTLVFTSTNIAKSLTYTHLHVVIAACVYDIVMLVHEVHSLPVPASLRWRNKYFLSCSNPVKWHT